MSQALYRKYRSRSFDQIIGQQGVIKALKNALKNDAISHAYLFTGPRGVGKTSVARILAYAINDMSYDSDELPLDIIEIDAASNRGIDEVRDLRDKVRISPTVGPYKVYIIDEVHMLTSHAFNALLKTLEEPPAHVVFILATTEGHKLPETITSRTQRYNFTLASNDEIVEHLAGICKVEGIKIDQNALKILAKSSGGSLRDALSLLDHAQHLGGDISEKDIRKYIGVPDEETVNAITTAIANGDSIAVLECLKTAETTGVSAASLALALLEDLTTSIQNGTNKLASTIITDLLHHLIEVESSTQQELKLKIALLSATEKNSQLPEISSTVYTVQKKSKPNQVSDQVVPVPGEAQARKSSKPTNTNKESTVEPSPGLSQKPLRKAKEITQNDWQQILEEIRQSHNTLYSVLRMARLDIGALNSNTLALYFNFPFHLKRISEAKNKKIIREKISDLGYGNYEINCQLSSDNQSNDVTLKSIANSQEEKDPVLSQIRGVFGSAEVLE